DVTVARAVRDRMRLLRDGVVRENLERRPAVAVPGEPQVEAADVRAGDAGPAFEPRAGEIALRRQRGAAEHLDVEARELAPVARDQVGVRVTNHFTWQVPLSQNGVTTGHVMLLHAMPESAHAFW